MAPPSNTAQLRAFARSLQYVMRIPGSHGAISNEDLFDILAQGGRDFGADSPRLRAYITEALVAQFAGDKRMPGQAQLRQIASAAIVEWVVMRFENMLRDVPIKPNASAYRAWKREHATYTAPGMRTGALRTAIKERGRAKIL
tara:strand:+ start:291 stop:719 length:429 start_codon:yes stop_codon:yes gene_type:complete